MDDKPKKRGRPRGSKNKVQKKVDTNIRDMDKAVKKKGPKALATSKTFSLIRYTEELVLRGENAKEIKCSLLVKGHKVSLQKTYRMINIAKQNIKKRFEKDFEINYQFCVENLMDIHNKAAQDDDLKTRLQVIDKFMQLAGLSVQRVEQITMNVTKEQMEEYENLLFG